MAQHRLEARDALNVVSQQCCRLMHHQRFFVGHDDGSHLLTRGKDKRATLATDRQMAGSRDDNTCQ